MTVGYRSGPRLKGGRNVDIIIRDRYEEMSKYEAGKYAEFIRKKTD